MNELAVHIGAEHMMQQIHSEEEEVLAALAGYSDLKQILDQCEREWLDEAAHGARPLDANDPEALLLNILRQRAHGTS